MSKWYTDTTNEWTLDYPPLFAHFECLLGKIAHYIDPQITNLNNLYYSSRACIIFQRMTVIVVDLIWLISLGIWAEGSTMIFIGTYLNMSMILVDNIHFFYGSMLYGVLVFALFAAKKGEY